MRWVDVRWHATMQSGATQSDVGRFGVSHTRFDMEHSLQ